MAGKKTNRKLKRRNGQWVHPAANVTLAPAPWDHGADGPANRIGLVIEERGDVDAVTGKVTNPNGVTGARRVDMLEVYAKRGWISARGRSAGEALRMAWLRTEMGTCPPWLRERVDSSPKPDAAVGIQIDRLSKLLRISRLVMADDARIIHTVVEMGAAIGALPEYRGSKHERGKLHLFEALERLADRVERA